MLSLAHRLPRIQRTCVRGLLPALFIVASAALAAAQTWTPLAAPPHPIAEHTATLLLDGRVLIVGSGGPPLLLDPRGGTWSSTNNPPPDLTRSYPGAVLLHDGRVLVTGGAIVPPGGVDVPAESTTWLFDPRINTWTAGAALSTRRYAPAIARLADGRVLVAGGRTNAGLSPVPSPLSSAEIYNPTTGAWTMVGSMSTGRLGCTLTPLTDGTLLITGGEANDTSADIFDPVTEQFTAAAATAGAHVFTAGLLMPDGRVHLTGDGIVAGNSGPSNRRSELYDAVAGTFALSSAINYVTPSSALLPDGRILIVGNNAGSSPNNVLYTPGVPVGTFAGAPDEHTNGTRQFATMTLLPDGRVLLMGGGAGVTPAAEIFDPRTVTAQPAAIGSGPRWTAGSVVLADGRVLVVGGVNGVQALATASIYNPVSNTWQPAGSMSGPRINNPDVVLLRDGRVMVLGGSNSNLGLAGTDIFNPATTTWQAGPSMHDARTLGSTVTLSNGWVLAFGGKASLFDVAATSAAEMYIPELDRWIPIAPMPEPRWRGAAVRLADDRVLFAGGMETNVAKAEAWIYNYRTNTWTPTASLSTPRQDTQMKLLPDGRAVLIGLNNSGTSEVWNPATGTWSLVPMAGTAGFDGMLVTLPSGEVALVSGAIGNGGPSELINEIKIFDPTSSSWSVAGALTNGRRDAEVAVLLDGRLLVVGGSDNDNEIEAPELVTITRGSDPSRVPTMPDLGTLPLGSSPGIVGTGFEPPHAGASSMLSVSSQTNQPFVRYRSLVTGEQGFLPITRFKGSQIEGDEVDGRSLGAAFLNVSVNGVASRSQIAAFQGRTPTGTATAPSSRYNIGDRQIALFADFNSVLPVGGGVALGLVTTSGGEILGNIVRAIVSPADGTVTMNYVVPGGTPVGTYTVTIVYAGDDRHEPIAIHTSFAIDHMPTTLTLTPVPTTVTRGGTVNVTATVAPEESGPLATGTTLISNDDRACSVSAPAGTCTLAFPTLGHVRLWGQFAPDSPSTMFGSTTETTVNVTCPDITLTPTTLPQGHVDSAYSAVLSASGGFAPYSFALVGTAPAGLTLDGDTLSGTPTSEFDGMVTVRATEAGGACTGERSVALTIGPRLTREYTLAEGVSNGFFASFILIVNPNASDAPITLTYAGENGATATETRTLPPFSRLTIPTGAGSITETTGSSFATRITSESGVPLVIERATYFDSSLRAGDLSTASEGDGSTSWYFAEGANGYFHTYLTLGSLDATQTATVTARYLPEAGAAFERQYTVAPHSRMTIDTRSEPVLAANAFSTTLQSTRAVAADRVQYFGSPFIGAHADSGARALSRDWYFAEGANGSAFDTYLLLGNPSADDANVTVTFHTDPGEAIARTYVVAAGTRRSIDVASEDPRLDAGPFWTEVHADQPIVAERAMYVEQNNVWSDATDTTGATAPGLRWGLAEGASGLSLGYAPYVLIANPNADAATITVEYLRTTGGTPLSHSYTVPAHARLTLDVRAEEPSLSGSEFGIIVTSTNNRPIIVERSQYWTLGGANFVGAMNTMGTPLPPLPRP